MIGNDVGKQKKLANHFVSISTLVILLANEECNEEREVSCMRIGSGSWFRIKVPDQVSGSRFRFMVSN